MSNNTKRLEGKVILITGAGSGTGRAMAVRFAAEGAIIIGSDIDAARIEGVAQEVNAAGGKMTGVRSDISKLSDIEEFVKAATEGHGRLDALVNNAGIMDLFEGVANVKDDTWHRIMAVNVYGPMAASRLAVRHMKEHGGGSIVNIASVAGVGGAAAGAAYTASKHALIGLTRNTAYTYARQGIRCNALVLGGVNTNIMTDADMSGADMEALEQFKNWHAAMPAQLEPEEIANAALFLVSDESKMINGALMTADAGWTAA